MTKLFLLSLLFLSSSACHSQSCGRTKGDDYPGSFASSTSGDRCDFGGGGGPGILLGSTDNRNRFSSAADGTVLRADKFIRVLTMQVQTSTCLLYPHQFKGFKNPAIVRTSPKRGQA